GEAGAGGSGKVSAKGSMPLTEGRVMKSPFPGMDPYVEGRGGLWEDFHHDLISEIKHAIAGRLPGNFAVRNQFRAYVILNEDGSKNQHALVADAGIYSVGTPGQPAPGGAAVLQTAIETEPQNLRAFVAEEYREAFLEIYEVEPEWRLVTCIEVLSPSNKLPQTAGSTHAV